MLALVSCNKTDTPATNPGEPEENVKTATLYVPYYEEQLEYIDCEFTVSTPDGNTRTVKLSKATAKNDSSSQTNDLREQAKNVADMNGVTSELKVFKVCSFEVRENEKYSAKVKFSTTGTFKTGKTEFNMVCGGSWFLNGGNGTSKESSAHVYKGVYADEKNLKGLVSVLNESSTL